MVLSTGATGEPIVSRSAAAAPASRTVEAASGSPVALRLDGPVGYTFDLETEAGRFDHASYLVSPVLEKAYVPDRARIAQGCRRLLERS